jgi:hypothetical protein
VATHSNQKVRKGYQSDLMFFTFPEFLFMLVLIFVLQKSSQANKCFSCFQANEFFRLVKPSQRFFSWSRQTKPTKFIRLVKPSQTNTSGLPRSASKDD